MPARDRRVDRAITVSHRLAAYAIAEIRSTRVALGLSQDDIGASVGMSGSQVGRFERGELQDVALDQLCRLSASVGLVPIIRLYPDGDPIRDVAQVRLLERLRARLPSRTSWRTGSAAARSSRSACMGCHRRIARLYRRVRGGDSPRGPAGHRATGSLEAPGRRNGGPCLPGRGGDTSKPACTFGGTRGTAGELPA